MNRFIKTVTILLLVSGISLVASLDLNGLFDWLSGEIVVSSGNQLATVSSGDSWPVTFEAEARDAFGRFNPVTVPADEYDLSMEPLDTITEASAKLDGNHVRFSDDGIFHLRFTVTLTPNSGYSFPGDNRNSDTWDQIVLVGRDPSDDWFKINPKSESAKVQRHLNIVGRIEFTTAADPFMPWAPDQVVSTDDATYMCNRHVFRLRGLESMDGGYHRSDGTTDQEIEAPPVALGSPAMCIFNNQWILAGGETAEKGYSTAQLVFAFNFATEQWSELPVLPREVSHVEVIGDFCGQLTVMSTPYDEVTRTWGKLTRYTLTDDQWISSPEPHDFPVGGRMLPAENGYIITELPGAGEHRTIKLQQGSTLRTISLVRPGYFAPVTLIDGRVFQWTEDGTYELSPDRFRVTD